MPSRMSASLTSSSSTDNRSAIRTAIRAPAVTTSARAGVHRGQGPDLLDCARRQSREHGAQGGQGDHRPVHPAAVVALELEVDPSERGGGAGHADPGADGAEVEPRTAE